MMECWHGIWGGYSYESEVIGNVFAYNEEAIAWEHGQDNVVEGNFFWRNGEDIVVWSNATQDPNWGYAKHRDTRSRDWTIKHNTFAFTPLQVFRFARSERISVEGNFITSVGRVFKTAADVNGLVAKGNQAMIRAPEPELGDGQARLDQRSAPMPQATSLNPGEYDNVGEYIYRFEIGRPSKRLDTREIRWRPWETGLGYSNPYALDFESQLGSARFPTNLKPKPLKGGIDPFLAKDALRGWRYILVDEWGPYDFKSPKLWPRGKTEMGALLFEILGPKGTWNATTFRGGKLNKTTGDVPGFVEVTLNPGEATDLYLNFEYKGEEITTPFGEKIPKGKASRFSYRKFFAPISWDVKWFSYDKATQEPRTMQEAFMKLLQTGSPIKTEKTDALDYAWGGAIGKDLPGDHFATVAEGKFTVPAGNYTLNVTSDDGVRVFVDGKKVLEDWTWHAPKLDKAELKLTAGEHSIRVEHFEIDGYSTLKVALAPKE